MSTCFAQNNAQVGLPDGAIGRLGKGSISVMRFSPDGKHLAVGTSIGAWLYDVNMGSTKALFRSEPRTVDLKVYNKPLGKVWTADRVSYIRYVAFSHDSKILAVSEADNFVTQLWDVESGKELSMLPATHTQDKAYAIAFSDDGKSLITPHYFGEVIHWDLASGKIIKVLKDHSDHHYEKIEITRDGKTFVSGDSKDGEIRLWDAADGKLLTDFEAKSKSGVNRLALSPDLRMAASAHDSNIIRLWDISNGSESAKFIGHTERINTIVFSPDGKLLVSGSEDETIKFWDLSNKSILDTLTGRYGGVKELTFSPDGHILVSGCSDGSIRFWDVNSRQEESIFATGHISKIKSVAFTTDNTKIATAAENGSVQIWDLETRELLLSPSVSYYDKTIALALSDDATMYASHGSESTVRSDEGGVSTSWRPYSDTNLWILPTGDKLATLQQESASLTFSPDNNILAAATRKELRFIDTETWEEVITLDNRNPFEEKLLFSPNGKMFATHGIHTKTRIWDLSTKLEFTPDDIKDGNALAFSPDSKLMASSHHEGVELWDILPEGIQRHKTHIDAQRGFGEVLLFSPDSKILLHATAKQKDIIQLWDVGTGNDLGTLGGHAWRIYSLVFSHDGKTLASGAGDGTVLLWDWQKISQDLTKNKENTK